MRERRPPGLVVSVVFGAGLLGVLHWQFAGVADDGLHFQVLDPGLPGIWKGVLMAAIGVSTAASLVTWVRCRWSMPFAIANAIANAVATAVTIALTAEGLLFAPSLPTQIGTTFETTNDGSGLIEPFMLLVVGIAIWDSLDGILRARRSRLDAEAPR